MLRFHGGQPHFAITTSLLSNSGMFPEPKFISSNGIRLAVHEHGNGPAVIMVHGFPELAFSWRFQLPALANAGFRAIAPDMRGYGQSDAPPNVEDYRIQELIADLHGLLDAMQLERAVFVGHDWGAIVLWHMAMLTPERIEKLIILNIPHIARPPIDPIQLFRKRLGDNFYIVNFQDSDEADRQFAADPGHFIDMMMRKNQIRRAEFQKLPHERRVLDLLKVMSRSSSSGEPLLNQEERDYFANAFKQTGFTPDINWYRNFTRNWESMADVVQVIDIPTLFIGAVDDVVIGLEQIEAMRPLVTDLTLEMLEPCGHWTQQERPEDVNKLMLKWLKSR